MIWGCGLITEVSTVNLELRGSTVSDSRTAGSGCSVMPGSLTDLEIADVLSYVRASWGNTALPSSLHKVADNRGSPLW